MKTAAKIIPLLVAGLIAACTSNPRRPWLERLLSAPACPLPCWEGVTPGETSTEDARAILSSVRDASLLRSSMDGLDWRLDERDHAFLEVTNGVVTKIVLNLAVGEEPALGRFTDAWGMPSLVTLTSCLHGTCVVELSYPREDAILSLMVPAMYLQGVRVNVSDTAPVGRLYMVADVDLWMSEAAWFEAPPTEWRGFGDYP